MESSNKMYLTISPNNEPKCIIPLSGNVTDRNFLVRIKEVFSFPFRSTAVNITTSSFEWPELSNKLSILSTEFKEIMCLSQFQAVCDEIPLSDYKIEVWDSNNVNEVLLSVDIKLM
jgi:hypothetical protein